MGLRGYRRPRLHLRSMPYRSCARTRPRMRKSAAGCIHRAPRKDKQPKAIWKSSPSTTGGAAEKENRIRSGPPQEALAKTRKWVRVAIQGGLRINPTLPYMTPPIPQDTCRKRLATPRARPMQRHQGGSATGRPVPSRSISQKTQLYIPYVMRRSHAHTCLSALRFPPPGHSPGAKKPPPRAHRTRGRGALPQRRTEGPLHMAKAARDRTSTPRALAGGHSTAPPPARRSAAAARQPPPSIIPFPADSCCPPRRTLSPLQAPPLGSSDPTSFFTVMIVPHPVLGPPYLPAPSTPLIDTIAIPLPHPAYGTWTFKPHSAAWTVPEAPPAASPPPRNVPLD